MLRAKGKTTPIGKQGQILAYASLQGARRMGLKEISVNTGISLVTCSNIIREAKRRAAAEGGNPDLCATENLTPKPNAQKGCNAVITLEQKQALIDLALSDAEHCRMAFADLAREGMWIRFKP